MEVKNRFKGLHLIDRVPEQLQKDVCNIVQKVRSKPSQRRRNTKGQKFSEEALKITVKRREVKCKEEKERYTHLSAEFHRIARRDKKDFISDQCKDIEENSRIGKTRDLFKIIRDTKGIFHAKWAQ